MWNRITRVCDRIIVNIYSILPTVILLSIMYWAIAAQVFAFRHPWATKTEQFLYTKEALLFRTISYKEVRDSYK
jgi:hypothetical protein